jgi:hypothetical protein
VGDGAHLQFNILRDQAKLSGTKGIKNTKLKEKILNYFLHYLPVVSFLILNFW